MTYLRPVLRADRAPLTFPMVGFGEITGLPTSSPMPFLLQESNNVHPLWQRAEALRMGASDPSVLLGLTWPEETQLILARANSGLDTPIDLKALKGRTFGLPVSGREADIERAMALRAYRTVLTLAGLTFADVQLREVSAAQSSETALLERECDVLYATGTRARDLQAAYHFDLVLDLGKLKDPRLRINANTPKVITTTRRVLDADPQSVVEGLHTLITARMQDGAYYGNDTWEAQAVIPSLEPARIEALQNQAGFLFEESLLRAPVVVQDWIESAPLEAALKAPF